MLKVLLQRIEAGLERVDTIHDRLMTALRVNGITQQKELIDEWRRKHGEALSRQLASKWFNGAVENMSTDNLFKIADLTGFSARWILRKEGPPGRWIPADPEKQEVMTIFDELDEERRARWVAYGRDLVQARGAERVTAKRRIPNL